LEAVFDQFGAALRAFVGRRVGNPEAAADLTQEIWLKVHERLPTLRNTEKLEPWLYRIARHAIIDHTRRTRPVEALPDELPADEPEPALPDLRPALARFIERLSSEDRQALHWTEYEGLTQKEVAARLGLSLSGAKSRIQRARAQLGEMLAQCCRFEFDRRGRVIEAIPREPGENCECQ
jgi:RNA polymerase sigma-70 factor (ECF subfamily)